jgi:DNA ligase (NAD+)
MDKIQKDMERLTEQLNLWAHLYSQGTPEVDDSVYDAQYRCLQQLEQTYPKYRQEDSPINAVPEIRGVDTGMKVPMLSIRTETDYSLTGAQKFVERVEAKLGRKPADGYVTELKYDGIAVNARYVYGHLVKVNTRKGEDITRHVLQLRLPKFVSAFSLWPVFEVRGEAIMSAPGFHFLNKALEDAGLKQYLNKRNAVAGLLNRKEVLNDPDGFFLGFKPYSLGEVDYGDSNTTHGLKTQIELVEMLSELLAKYRAYQVPVNGTKQLFDSHQQIEHERGRLTFDIDGVVYKVNNLAEQEELGWATDSPHWAVAHKFAPQAEVTTIENIKYQVGRTGKITPVAEVSPVFVSGTWISNVSLFNEQEINRLGVAVGSTVTVQRAGDVIPKIVNTVSERQEGFDLGTVLKMQCPSCKSPITKEPTAVDWYCTGGVKCPEQQLALFEHYVSKDAMYIEGLGPTALEKLLFEKVVLDFSDLYQLTESDLVRCNTAPANAKKVVNNIKASMVNVDPARLYYALGIRYIGKESAKELTNRFYIDLDVASLQLLVEAVGSIKANSIIAYFAIESNRRSFAELKQRFSFIEHHPTALIEQKLFTITGSFPKPRRDIIEEMSRRGFTFVDDLTKKNVEELSFLLVGMNPTQHKLDFATKHGVNFIYEF